LTYKKRPKFTQTSFITPFLNSHKKMKNYLIYILFAFATIVANAQTIDPSILQKQWRASWVAVPKEPNTDYGVYLFRKTIEMASKPASFVIHASADNRYKLFVNGQLVSLGPARGDLNHWNFETVDLAPYLKTGRNVLAAQVWNEGKGGPEAQISLQTGFILQGATDAEKNINTNTSWKCKRDTRYSPIKFNVNTYYVAGFGELVNMKEPIKNWENADFNDENWLSAQPIFNGVPKNVLGAYGSPNGWMLVPSAIPQMEMKQERFGKVLKTNSVEVPKSFPTEKVSVTIPANTVATILLDQNYLTNAYPTLVFSGGTEGGISLMYAEALYTKFPAKGNRNDVEGKQFLGRKDSILSDGSKGQTFTALTYRTYRYVQITVKTKNEPLVIDDIYGSFTGYPFKMNAKLETNSPEMDKILEIGWRTARLCATETYMDCPYYEQMQYIGDARIQGLVSLYNSGDDRLLKNALNLMDFSRQPEGVTLSRHPSYTPQYIPTFSLWYIGMLHDYALYGKDTDFIKQKLSGARQILDYFQAYQQADGSLKGVPQWMFTDWVTTKDWVSGVGPLSKDGTSALLDLQLLFAYQTAADLEARLGMKAYSERYTEAANQLKATIKNKYWDAQKHLFADRIEKDLFSQHANALAILTGLVEQKEAQQIVNQMLSDTTLAPASIYFKYYLHQAFIKAGLGDGYLSWLDKWRENIKMGLTTWGEDSNVNTTRSDCHAWGSSPNIEFFRTVLGIDSDGLGFSKVKIEPHLGDLKKASGSMPHPNGVVSVSYLFEKGKWQIALVLPKNTEGVLVWKGEKVVLKSGANTFLK
jgi:alpha-L-rhamnosidase